MRKSKATTNSQPRESGLPQGKTPYGTVLEVRGHTGCGLLRVTRVSDGVNFICNLDDLRPLTQDDERRIQEMVNAGGRDEMPSNSVEAAATA